MTWGSSCPQCGLLDCKWLAGPYCEGGERIKAFKQFAPEWRTRWPLGTRWLARRISDRMVELESQNEYFRRIVKNQFDDIRLVDVKIKPDEFKALLRTGVGGIIVSWMLQAMRAIGAKSYVEIRGEHPQVGELAFTIVQMSGESPAQRADRYEKIIRSYVTPRPVEDWHEDLGDCLFWHLDDSGKPTETPYCGTPNDTKTFRVLGAHGRVEEGYRIVEDAKPDGKIRTIDCLPFPAYATHFTRLPDADMKWQPPEPPAQ